MLNAEKLVQTSPYYGYRELSLKGHRCSSLDTQGPRISCGYRPVTSHTHDGYMAIWSELARSCSYLYLTASGTSSRPPGPISNLGFLGATNVL
jgi:hypothetical protein